jgi:hypothetical protein
MLEGLRKSEDPGLDARRLAVSNALDIGISRPVYPRVLGEAAVVALLTLSLISALWVLP